MISKLEEEDEMQSAVIIVSRPNKAGRRQYCKPLFDTYVDRKKNTTSKQWIYKNIVDNS